MVTPLVGITPIYAICFLGFGIGKKLQVNKDNPDQELT